MPFSTLSSLGMLHELGVSSEHEAVSGGLDLVLKASRDDGRICVAPKAPLYPCYTAEAARILCRFGLTDHKVLERTISYLIENAHETGGWRCSFSRFGKGPETELANPGATLYVLDILRFFTDYRKGNDIADGAVESLLEHWDIKKPTGPCHWDIGSLFMQVEYPFLRYNLFFYVYVLSFFNRAKGDHRFQEALFKLKSNLNEKNQVVLKIPTAILRGLNFVPRESLRNQQQ